jgi:hypothetical protein
MKDIYYRFPNSGTAYKIAHQAGFLSSGEQGWKLNAFTQDYAIDLIGDSISGVSGYYHLNLRILGDSFMPPSGAEPYKINTPNSPARQWL